MTIASRFKRPPSFSVHWLRSPWAILISVILGVYIGTSLHGVADLIAPIGELYLGLLKMCVMPILLAAITTSIGRLMGTSNAGQYIRRILIVFPVSLLLISILSLIIAMITGPGRNLSVSTLETLGVLVNNSGVDMEISLTGPIPEAEESLGLTSFFLNMVPENIFTALSEGQTLKVLVFAIVFGITLGLIKEPITQSVFDALESVYKAFNRIIHWMTYLLPFGLCSLLAHQLSQLGLDVMFSMLNFILIAIATFVTIYIICTLIIWYRAKVSLLKVLSVVKEPTILALATSSSLACLPSAISTLHEELKFEAQATSLVTPLSITVGRFGSVIYFVLASVFVAQLYDAELGLPGLFIIVIGSIFAGMATSGVTGILTLTMMGLVLEPLKLPLEAVLVLFIAIDPIMDPFRTLGIVHTGMATTAMVADLET